MPRMFYYVFACMAAVLGGPVSAATTHVNVPLPITRAIIELGTTDVFPIGVGNWGLDNLITVYDKNLDFVTFDEIPSTSFGGPPPPPFGGPTTINVGNTWFRGTRLDPTIPFTYPTFGFDPGDENDTVFTDGPLLLADANTRVILDFVNPVDILQFGLAFASGFSPCPTCPVEFREGLVGTVELFALGGNSLGRFQLQADIMPGDVLPSARFTATVPVPATGMLLLSALGLGFAWKLRSRSA